MHFTETHFRFGCYRTPKSNTAKRRTHSLFRQGSMLYELIPTMPEHRLRPLIEEFALKLAAQPVLNEMFGAIKNEGDS